MKLQPSASRSSILLECSFPFSIEVEPEEAGEPARYGTSFHSLLAWLLLNKGKKEGYERQVDLAVVAGRLPPSSSRDLPGHARSSYGLLAGWLKGKNPWGRDFLREKLEVEKSYALGLGKKPTVRNIRNPTAEGHVYEDLLPGEISGTADLVLGPLVIDHKTGSSETFDDPSQKPQLKTLALVPFLRGEKRPIAGVLHASRRGLPVIHADEVEVGELKKHARTLGEKLSRIGDGSLRPGPWCGRCPAREVCPAQHGDLLKRSSEIVKSSMGVKEFLDGDDGERRIMVAADIGRYHLLFHQLEALLQVGRKEIRPVGRGASLKRLSRGQMARSWFWFERSTRGSRRVPFSKRSGSSRGRRNSLGYERWGRSRKRRGWSYTRCAVTSRQSSHIRTRDLEVIREREY